MKTNWSMKVSIAMKALLVVIYAFFIKIVTDFLQVGGVARRLPPILILAFFLTVILITLIFIEKRKLKRQGSTKRIRKISSTLCLCFMLIFTGYGGVKAYKSINDVTSKISRHLNEVSITVKNMNLYNDGINNIIKAIDGRVNLPDEIYLRDSFSLKYKDNGEITDISFGLYGKSKSGKYQGYLVSFDSKKGDKIIVYKNSYQGESFDKKSKFSALSNAIKEALTNNQSADTGRISANNEPAYNNDNTIEYSKGTITCIDSRGARKDLTIDDGKREPQETKDETTTDDFFATKQVGYRFVVADAAAGTRFYSLEKTVDGGDNWNMYNKSPFLQDGGSDPTASFVNEDVGIFIIGRNSGSESRAYLTTDGGKTTKLIDNIIPQVSIGGAMYQVYDYPTKLIMDGSTLTLEVGQGADGDYNNNDSQYMISPDMGVTWTVK